MKKTGLYIVLIFILMSTGCGSGKDTELLQDSPESESQDLVSEELPPRAVYGKLTEDKVRIRNLPGLGSEMIGQLMLGEEVQVLCRTSDTYIIHQMEDYWYVIKRNNGMVGWTYGYYIKFDEPADNAIYIHNVDYGSEVTYTDKIWIGEYSVYRLLNKHNLPSLYAEKLLKTEVRITLEEEYEFYMAYHPDINEKEYILLNTMKQMDGFIVHEYDPGRIEVSFINNYVVVIGESILDNKEYTYEIYYKKKTD